MLGKLCALLRFEKRNKLSENLMHSPINIINKPMIVECMNVGHIKCEPSETKPF